MTVHHLNCVKIESPFGMGIGHCLLLEENGRLILIDSGIGLAETREPEDRLGKELVAASGFRFDESLTAIRQLEELGYHPGNVTDIICSHLDPDHIGGLVDFPHARVHISQEEYVSFREGNARYLPQQLSHNPTMRIYDKDDGKWFGFPSRRLDVGYEIYFIPLFGHTLGHCGVSFMEHGRWIFYAADAYYLRAELTDKNHPVNQLATIRAVDNEMRMQTLDNIRRVVEDHGHQITHFCYHDPSELADKS